MFITCRQQETIAEFHEKVPEERRDILQSKVSRKGVAGIDYKYGSSSGYAGGSKSIQTEKSTIADELQDGSQDQMLIKKATISFDVKDYSKARKRIVDIIKSNDAYISSEYESKNDYQISNTMQIRVASDKFEPLIDSLIGQANNLDQKIITVKDVTEEFVDVKARINAKKQVEKRYLEILSKAESVKEILEVEQKLGQIREEIESREGRLKYLSHQVSLSTINITFYQQKTAIPKSRINFLNRLSSSFISGWRGLIEFLLDLVSIWPFLIIITGVVFFIYKLFKRLKRKKV
jgi:hypothetical protein